MEQVDEPKTQMKTQNSNLTFEKADEPQYDFSEYADRLWKIAYERGKREALEQTEPQTDCPQSNICAKPCKECGACEEECGMWKVLNKPQTERSE